MQEKKSRKPVIVCCCVIASLVALFTAFVIWYKNRPLDPLISLSSIQEHIQKDGVEYIDLDGERCYVWSTEEFSSLFEFDEWYTQPSSISDLFTASEDEPVFAIELQELLFAYFYADGTVSVVDGYGLPNKQCGITYQMPEAAVEQILSYIQDNKTDDSVQLKIDHGR